MWKSPDIISSGHFFSDSAYNDRLKEFYDIGSQINSNLPLQIALYFNVWLLPIWFCISLVSLDAKYYYLSDVYKFVTIAIFFVISIFECARLYLGYLGNLAEKIPELASFWLLSTLIQLPLEMFLLLDNRVILQFTERIVNSVMIFFLAIEIIAGTVALKNLANYYTKRFYIAQLYGINTNVN